MAVRRQSVNNTTTSLIQFHNNKQLFYYCTKNGEIHSINIHVVLSPVISRQFLQEQYIQYTAFINVQFRYGPQLCNFHRRPLVNDSWPSALQPAGDHLLGLSALYSLTGSPKPSALHLCKRLLILPLFSSATSRQLSQNVYVHCTRLNQCWNNVEISAGSSDEISAAKFVQVNARLSNLHKAKRPPNPAARWWNLSSKICAS